MAFDAESSPANLLKPLDALHYDILSSICAAAEFGPLRTLSLTCKAIRDASAPYLFRDIRISEGWRRATRALELASSSACFGHHVRSFMFQTSMDGGVGSQTKDQAGALLSMLRRMLGLNRLVLIVPSAMASEHDWASAIPTLAFPRLTTLVLGPQCEFVVCACPVLENLSLRPWPRHTTHDQTRRLLRLASTIPTLKQFSAHVVWSTDLVQAVVRYLPDLQVLGLLGTCNILTQDLAVLSRLNNLERLEFSPATSASLVDGVYPTPRSLHEMGLIAAECACLHTLCVGQTERVEVCRDEAGRVINLSQHISYVF